jgi:hypothetical protein
MQIVKLPSCQSGAWTKDAFKISLTVFPPFTQRPADRHHSFS